MPMRLLLLLALLPVPLASAEEDRNPQLIEDEVNRIIEEYEAIKSNQDLEQARRRRLLATRLAGLPHELTRKLLVKMVEYDRDLRTGGRPSDRRREANVAPLGLDESVPAARELFEERGPVAGGERRIGRVELEDLDAVVELFDLPRSSQRQLFEIDRGQDFDLPGGIPAPAGAKQSVPQGDQRPLVLLCQLLVGPDGLVESSAVSIIIGTLDISLRRRHASHPSISGIIRSKRTRSGVVAYAFRRPESASWATSTLKPLISNAVSIN